MLRHLSRRAAQAHVSGNAAAGPSRALPATLRRSQLFASRQASSSSSNPSGTEGSSLLVDPASSLNSVNSQCNSSSSSTLSSSVRNQRIVTRSQPSSSFSTTSVARREAASSEAHAKRISSNPTSHTTPSSKPHIPDASPTAPLLQVSTLPNGVRVATDGTPGHFVAAGIYVGAGCRYEW